MHSRATAGGGTSATPASLTVHFVDRITPREDVVLAVTRLGGGRSIAHWRAELTPVDGSWALAHALVTLVNRRESDGQVEPRMPEAPDPSSLEESHAPGSQGRQTLIRSIRGFRPSRKGKTPSAAWVRLVEPRPRDPPRRAYLADQFAPRSFRSRRCRRARLRSGRRIDWERPGPGHQDPLPARVDDEEARDPHDALGDLLVGEALRQPFPDIAVCHRALG